MSDGMPGVWVTLAGAVPGVDTEPGPDAATVTYPQGSEGRVYYGQTFTAPCANDSWNEETHGYDDCPGTLTFGPSAMQAACDTCGGQCGRLVAFGLPSGAALRP